MRHEFPDNRRPFMGQGVASVVKRPAFWTGLFRAAEAQFLTSTRTVMKRAAAPSSSLFEHAGGRPSGAAARVWSDFNDYAHVDRRAPPGGDPGSRRQRKPDRGV